MDQNNTPATSRRSLLKAAGTAAVASGFLAACAKDAPAGVSGTPAPATSVPPTVPPKPPTEGQLREVQIQIRTLASVEVLTADVYDAQASKITDATIKSLVAGFGDDHRAAAAALVEMTDERKPIEANKVLKEEVVEPAVAAITDEAGVRSLLGGLESSLTATYIRAVQAMVDTDSRQKLMTLGGASARRVTVLSGGAAPAAALYPSDDLISNKAYLSDSAEGGPSGKGDANADQAANAGD